MMTRLLIARHGNTFTKNQMPTRVGARTDLPLVESGVVQAKKLGQYLQQQNFVPDIVYVSVLKRTQQTALQLLSAMHVHRDIIIDKFFNEIDYGVDENKTEEEVVARIGKEAIVKWDSEAIVPDGWDVDPSAIIQSWLNFGECCQQHHLGQNILVVTSNGIARFAPYLTGKFEEFHAKYEIKMLTGALSILENQGEGWVVKGWNIKP
jgi:2,3-bisphosphoglycerate-dependent phosphoglycerate mutase